MQDCRDLVCKAKRIDNRRQRAMVEKVEQVVYIVDDEVKVCQAICETLQDSGFKAICFTDPVQCLEKISPRTCDLLIADLKMPQIDGIELMKRAKLIVPWMPVLIITAYGDISTAVKATRAGAVDFIEKPLVKEDFVRKVRSMLLWSGCGGKRLTKTEAKVLKLVAQCKSNSEIAHILHRSTRTIELHRSHAMNKLGLRDFTDLLKRIGGTGVAEFLAENGQNQTCRNSGSKLEESIEQ